MACNKGHSADDGYIDLPNIVQSIQHKKLKMIQRAQDLNPESAWAAAHL